VQYQTDSAPVAKEPAIKNLDEVNQLKIPDPYKDPLLSELLKATRIVVDEIGHQAFIIGRADQGPFSLACEIRGMSEFLLDIALNEKPNEINQLLDFCRQVCHRYAIAQIEQGAHATSIGDSTSGPDVISPKYYRKFAYPHVKKLANDLKSENIILAYHICGNSTPIIKEMVGSGAAILEIDQKADLQISKDAAAGKATLLGPIDPSDVMANASTDVVVEKCREAIDILAPGGGFILGPGCALPASTPDDNILAMIETAREFGQFESN
jgi:uroporphyrinogen decarboxylase